MEEKVFDGLITETNGWYLTDDSCYQYCKELGNRKYSFIQYTWIDLCEGDDGYPDKEYLIQIDDVDLNDYTKEDIECYISPYGYGSLKEIYDEYEDGADEIIAECVFEQTDAWEEKYGSVTEGEAQEIIVNYIRNN